MEECPGLRNVQESAGGARTHRATETMQKEQSKGLLFSAVRQGKGNCTEEGKGKAPVYPCCG